MSRRRGGVSIGRSYRRYHGLGGAIYRSETETKVSWRFAPLRHILTARLSPHERALKSLTTVFRARDYRRIRDSAYASVDGVLTWGHHSHLLSTSFHACVTNWRRRLRNESAQKRPSS